MASPINTKPNDAAAAPPPQPGRGHSASAGGAEHERERRLRAVFDQAAEPMWVLGPDGYILEVNRAAAEFGGSAEQVTGRPFWAASWWEAASVERTRVQDAVTRAVAGEFVSLEAELPGEAGRSTTMEITLKPVRGEGEEVELLIAAGADVTEVKWAERELRVSEAKFAGIISIASDAIISVDENQRITLFNQGAEAIFGYTPAEVLGQKLDMLLPRRYRTVHTQHLRNFAASPAVSRRMGERQEILGQRRDGTEFPAEASISKLDLFGSRVFSVLLRDITDRKRIERAQRFLAQAGTILASSLDYETTLGSVGALIVPELADWSVVYIREDDGTVRRLEIAHADPARRGLLLELMRYPLDPRSPHPVFTVLETGRPEMIPEVGDTLLRALSHDEQQLSIYRSLGLGSLLIVPLVARGETRGAMGFFSEAVHRYGAEEAALAQDLALLAALAVDNARLYRNARAAIQARDDMITVVSHDLGNPLSAIRIGTSLLLRSVPPAEQETGGWKHLEFIRQSAEQMERLINDLLDVKRLEAGRVTLQIRDVRIENVVHDVIELFEPIARGRSLELTSELHEPLPTVPADYQRLSQVLSNLLGNALKFTEPGGRVRIEVRRAGEGLIVAVSDTGRGIAPEHLPHVFDRFWQAQPQIRKGLGMGLAIARGIVEAHGGRIWVESEAGAGTTVLFTLPLVQPTPQKPRAS
jgi:PAS domain S-box-containing protein